MMVGTRTSTSLLLGMQDPQNEGAWQRFFERYTPMLLCYAKRTGLGDADAQDVVSETLMVFVEAYGEGKYDRTKGRLKSWLGGIVQNKVRKAFSRRTMDSAGLESFDPGAALVEPSCEILDEAFEREWALERLSAALQTIRRNVEPSTYQAFDLYALKGWKVQKVASFLKMTPNAIYVNKAKMIKKLRVALQDDEPMEEQRTRALSDVPTA